MVTIIEAHIDSRVSRQQVWGHSEFVDAHKRLMSGEIDNIKGFPLCVTS